MGDLPPPVQNPLKIHTMAGKHEKLIEDLAKAMIEHSIDTLDAFDELPEDASKEDQGKVLGALGLKGFFKIGSVLAAYDIDLVKILNSRQG